MRSTKLIFALTFTAAICLNSCARKDSIPNHYHRVMNLIPIAQKQGAEPIPVIAGRLIHFTEEFEALPLSESEDDGSQSLTLQNIHIPDHAMLSFSYFPPPPVLKAGSMVLSVQISSKENGELISRDYRIKRRLFSELLNYLREKWQIFYKYIDFYRHFTLDLSSIAGQIVDVRFTIRAPAPFADDQAQYEKWAGAHMPTPYALCNPAIYSQGAEPEKKPINLLFIIVDAMRPDAVGAYGYGRPTTPNIDKIAAEGLLIRRAYAPSNFTRGSVTSMFTGRYPSTLGLPLARWDLTDAEKDAFRILTSSDLSQGAFPDSLPRYLMAEGYVVEHIGSDPFIQDGTAIGASLGFSRTASFNQRRRDTEAIADQSLAFLQRNASRPFFLAVHFNNGHGPLRPPKRFQGIFDEPIENDPRIWPAAYDGEIRYADEKIGLMMDALREYGIEDETLVVICADHGQGFEVGHPKGHAHSLYDGEVRVPFIMRLPGRLPVGKKHKGTVSLLDFYPTFLELNRTRIPKGLDGTYFLDRWQKIGNVLGIYLDVGNINHEAWEIYLEGAGIRALMRGFAHYHEKIIVKDGPYERMRGRNPADKGRFAEYYNLALDPGEMNNIVDFSGIYQGAVFSYLRARKIERARTRFEQVRQLSELMEGAGTLYSECAHESVELILSAGREARDFKILFEFEQKPDSLRCYDCSDKNTITIEAAEELQGATVALVDLDIKAGHSRSIGFTPWPPDARFQATIECDGKLLNPNLFHAGHYGLPFAGNPASFGGLGDYILISDAMPPEIDPGKDFGVYIRYAPAVTKAKTGIGGQVKDALKSWGYVK